MMLTTAATHGRLTTQSLGLLNRRDASAVPEMMAVYPGDGASSGTQAAERRTGIAEAASASARSNVFDDLDAVVAAYEMRVFRFLLSSLRDRDLAETLTQETLLRAWSTRASFRGDCAPATWLMRLAVNLVRDHTRTNRFRFWKKAAAEAVDVADVSTWLPGRGRSAETNLIQREQLERIWETVATLSERQRSVFLLRFLEELELPEIAEATGMPVSTVKSHLYRALTIVRERHAGNTKETR